MKLKEKVQNLKINNETTKRNRNVLSVSWNNSEHFFIVFRILFQFCETIETLWNSDLFCTVSYFAKLNKIWNCVNPRWVVPACRSCLRPVPSPSYPVSLLCCLHPLLSSACLIHSLPVLHTTVLQISCRASPCPFSILSCWSCLDPVLAPFWSVLICLNVVLHGCSLKQKFLGTTCKWNN